MLDQQYIASKASAFIRNEHSSVVVNESRPPLFGVVSDEARTRQVKAFAEAPPWLYVVRALFA
jgi:hypothetical protein